MPEGQLGEQMLLSRDHKRLVHQNDANKLMWEGSNFLYGQAPPTHTHTLGVAYPLVLLFHDHVIPMKEGRQSKVYLTSGEGITEIKGSYFPEDVVGLGNCISSLGPKVFLNFADVQYILG